MNIGFDLFLLWPAGIIEAGEKVTQLLLLLLLREQRLSARSRDSVGRRQEVSQRLLAQGLGVALPPGGRVAETLVTHGGGAVDQQLAGGDQALQEGVTELGGEPLWCQVSRGPLGRREDSSLKRT